MSVLSPINELMPRVTHLLPRPATRVVPAYLFDTWHVDVAMVETVHSGSTEILTTTVLEVVARIEAHPHAVRLTRL